MGISIDKFLNKYFTSDELKAPLEDIGLSVGGKKSERIKRIVDNWRIHNRDWYELPYFLEWGVLAQICEDFGIPYSEYSKEETLCRKIAENRVLDFRNKPEKKSQKISEKPSISIREQNINIGSNNKINSDNTFVSNISGNQRKMIIIGIATIIVMIGIAAWQSYDAPETITNEITGDDNTVITGDGNIVVKEGGYLEYTEISPSFSELLKEFEQERILEREEKIKQLEEELLDISDENEKRQLEAIIDRLKIANYAIQDEDYPEAEKYYKLILTDDQENTDALEGLGLVLGRQDKYEESISSYSKLLTFDPDNYEALLNNGWSYAMLKDYETSMELLNKLSPDDLFVMSHKCWVFHKLHQHDEAIETCQKVLEHGTDDSRVAKAYSLSLSLSNRSEEALPFHEQLYNMFPNDFSTIINYGATLSDVGQAEKALKVYNDGLQKFPNHPVFENNKKALCNNNPELECVLP